MVDQDQADQEVRNAFKHKSLRSRSNKSKDNFNISKSNGTQREIGYSYDEMQSNFKSFSEYCSAVSPQLFKQNREQQRKQEVLEGQARQQMQWLMTVAEGARDQSSLSSLVPLIQNQQKLEDRIRSIMCTQQAQQQLIQDRLYENYQSRIKGQRGHSLPQNINRTKDQKGLTVQELQDPTSTLVSGIPRICSMEIGQANPNSGISQKQNQAQKEAENFESLNKEISIKAKQQLNDELKFEQLMKDQNDLISNFKRQKQYENKGDQKSSKSINKDNLNTQQLQLSKQPSAGRASGQFVLEASHSSKSLEQHSRHMGALHQISVKTNKHYMYAPKVKKTVTINADLQNSVPGPEPLSPMSPMPPKIKPNQNGSQELSYQFSSPSNHQEPPEQKPPASQLQVEQLSQKTSPHSRRRQLRINKEPQTTEQDESNGQNNQIQNRLTQNSGFYIDQVDGLAEQGYDYADLTWNELADWDSFPKHQPLQKNEMPQSQKANDYKVSQLQGGYLIGPHFDVNLIPQGDKIKASQFKGSKVQQNSLNPAPRRTDFQALLVGSSLKGGQQNIEPASPPSQWYQYSSRHRSHKRSKLRRKGKTFKYNGSPDPYNNTIQEQDQEELADSEENPSQERGAGMRRIRKGRQFGHPHRQGINVNMPLVNVLKLSQQGSVITEGSPAINRHGPNNTIGSFNVEAIADCDSPAHLPPAAEIEDITTWIKRKKKQAKSHNEQQEQLMVRYKNA